MDEALYSKTAVTLKSIRNTPVKITYVPDENNLGAGKVAKIELVELEDDRTDKSTYYHEYDGWTE